MMYFMYIGHQTTIDGVLERAQTPGARAEPITLEEAYARQAKRFQGEKNGLLVTVRVPNLPDHLQRTAVAWKPGAPNDDTIPLGQFEGMSRPASTSSTRIMYRDWSFLMNPFSSFLLVRWIHR